MEKSTKKTNFKRLAEARTNKLLSLLDLIGNLSNTSFYEYTEEDVNRIFDAIEKSVSDNKAKFKKDNKKEKRRFTL